MRLSEKTFEINFCSELSRRCRHRIIWFGLTQKQEARAGFDTCMRLGGSLLIFQFKISEIITPSGRRFTAPHKQMTNLIDRTRTGRSIFYVLPNFGETSEFTNKRDLLQDVWLLDVADIPISIQPPRKKDGSIRKCGHYIDITPPTAIIHSDPVSVPLMAAASFALNDISGSEGVPLEFDDWLSPIRFDDPRMWRNAAAAVVLPL